MAEGAGGDVRPRALEISSQYDTCPPDGMRHGERTILGPSIGDVQKMLGYQHPPPLACKFGQANFLNSLNKSTLILRVRVLLF